MTMKRYRYIRLLLAVVASATLTPALALEPIPITADDAFDAVATQTDPLFGTKAVVQLVDVRSRAEYYWVGTAARVDKILLRGKETQPILPDWGKVRLIHDGKFLEYTVGERYQRVQVDKVAELKTSPIALSIPYRLWDESQAQLVPNAAFPDAIDDLADRGVDILIVFCRSGARSTECIVDLGPAIISRFAGVYEIDDPSGIIVGVGGFEGSAYAQGYNGYRGFPGRLTEVQDEPSVSWKDSGLPIRTGVRPPLQ
jgi:rhodanese-related sulfurtransferase